MPPPLRRPRQKTAASPAASDKRRFTLRLSAPMATVLGVVLMAAVGWSFFMGFMVGRGQNPEQRVEQMTGLQRDKQTQQAPQGGPDTQNPPSATPPAATDLAATAQNGQGAQGADANTAGAQTAAGPEASAAPSGPEAAGAADESAYPFERPSGSSLAAWGIKQPQAGAQAGGQASGQAAQKPASAQAAAQAQKPTAPQAPMFDFVYQVAAFKNVDDADRLRKKLEERGIRSRLQKSGKVQLVMVSLRGTEVDAANLREELGRMKLGAPMQKSKKAVAGKGRSTGR
ncbi:SPOR domain-containing protein [Desulfovibrio intestinalis]|uniref:Cell division septation protein DedD n=1 Tax=Desulfovibrio intestinalis TaxID=58621 RepID=A0A7W8C0B5_9BACT|nr:SPOR domain-containing protein [Desulfovibrio intestinalis]MBB5143275.1 cell division septation protein DedD [Desulfovibrio intestinalis]